MWKSVYVFGVLQYALMRVCIRFCCYEPVGFSHQPWVYDVCPINTQWL